MGFQMKRDRIYLASPYGIGDLMVLCGLLGAVSGKYGCKAVPVVKPSHEAVMGMYGIREYAVRGFTEGELENAARSCPAPQKGRLFVAHAHFHKGSGIEEGFLEGRISFAGMFKRILGLPPGCRVEGPKSCPGMSAALLGKLSPWEPGEVTLLMPEMKSAGEYEKIPSACFGRLVRHLGDCGEKVVVNITGRRYGNIGGRMVPMGLEELAALSAACKKVISARSGACDLICHHVRELEVVYPNYGHWELFNLGATWGAFGGRVTEKTVPIAGLLRAGGYRRCAIYGYGEVGRRVLASLDKECFPVDYIIDRNAGCLNCPVRAYRADGALPGTDAILVSLSKDVEGIKGMLGGKTDADVLSLQEILSGYSF